METIKIGDSGSAVEDIQNRLVLSGHLDAAQVTGSFDDATASAVAELCKACGLPISTEVDEKVWAALVDASFALGDRTLYLRMPHFHGHDVRVLQQALDALGFSCGMNDAIFGAHTEQALRLFQLNLGIPSDGIAGAYTYAALRNLHHSWEGKEGVHAPVALGFSRAADVLESNALVLFGTNDFTRSVASRMSNLALATNPVSKVVSSDALSVPPDDSMLLVHIVVAEDDQNPSVPTVTYAEDDTFPVRIQSAVEMARTNHPSRLAIVLPARNWAEAGMDRSAQHYAIAALDALCTALSQLDA